MVFEILSDVMNTLTVGCVPTKCFLNFIPSKDKQNPDQGIYITLLNINEDTANKIPYSYKKGGNDFQTPNPSLYLNLFIMVSAYNDPYYESLKSIDKVIQNFVNKYHFIIAGGNIEYSLDMVNLSMEQNNNLWQAMANNILPHVIYKVRSVITDAANPNLEKYGEVSEILEIPSLPPSVTEVKSAIPAFLGYTQKDKYNNTSIVNQPIKIQSMLEFKNIFGDSVPYVFSPVTLDLVETYRDVVVNPQYYLFDSLQLYFLNGGGPCYIVSIGAYPSSKNLVKKSDFNDAFDVLDLYDEPTLYVMPDAVVLNDSDFAEVQQFALKKCATLMDRFAIFDVKKNAVPLDSLDSVKTFRDEIGMAYLSYGAAYTPWLNANLDKKITAESITGILATLGGLDSSILNFEVNGKKISDTISEYSKLINTDLVALKANCALVITAPPFKSMYNGEIANVAADNNGPFRGTPIAVDIATAQAEAIAAGSTATAARASVTAMADQLAADSGTAVFNDVTTAANATTNPTNVAFTAAQTAETTHPDDADFVARAAEAAAAAATTAAANIAADPGGILIRFRNVIDTTNSNTNFKIFFKANCKDFIDGLQVIFDAKNLVDKKDYLNTILQNGTLDRFDDLYMFVKQGLQSVIDNYEQVLINNIPYYAGLLAMLKKKVTDVPPSCIMAGLYCQTDSNKGVWKSPANISVSSVSGVTQLFTAPDLDSLNVDATAGKSINAIRPITGKGVMVMGARTLDGNSSEWRYISVRRLFIFIEENLKKNTAWAVFEPNDKMLWTSVKAQINNYLFELWRQGALAGSKPEDAYQVNVGLNSTMTPQDVLAGFLYIEVKLAAVRPAEFIVLKFSHQLQKSLKTAEL